MYIRSLEIKNFRAIRQLQLDNLPDAVVIAGPNGCGKSSLFDAIRLLKSAYGQYNPNEFQSFFQEFQINVQKLSQEAHRVFHDPNKELQIRAEFELSESERRFLSEQAYDLFLQVLWKREGINPVNGLIVLDPVTKRTREPAIKKEADKLLLIFKKELEKSTHVAEITMEPEGEPHPKDSTVIELIFNLYQPEDIGVLEYHGPNRNYIREQIGGINLRVQDIYQNYRQHALYNTENKYRNVKTEMAQSYIRQILAKQAGVQVPTGSDIHETLNELFEVFFPGKKFLGPVPTEDGELSFPVLLENGRRHDIDELSSGEKEVLLGYLRLRNNAPKNSIILLDEPELHLNPRLIRGLPRFYQKYLGKILGNQLWLITHSDALLREAVEEPAYAVYHMQPATYDTSLGSNQAILVSASAEVERVLIDLVGDLATYSPRSKVVILEGGGDSQFDVHLVEQLFPTFADRVNLISGGSKNGVTTLQVLLDKAAKDSKLDARFYSIVDKDCDGPEIVSTNQQYSWDVYHVENYLLNSQFIYEAVSQLTIESRFSLEDIDEQLRECARATIEKLVEIRLRNWVHDQLKKCIDIKFDPKTELVKGFRAAAERSLNKMNKVLEEALIIDKISYKKEQIQEELITALESEQWKVVFRGRDILKRFVGQFATGIKYESFRNLIINRMRAVGYQPVGMQKVIENILAD